MKKTKYLLFSAVLLASMQSVAQNPINDNPAYSIVGKDSTCQVFIYSPAENQGLHLAYFTDDDTRKKAKSSAPTEYKSYWTRSPNATVANWLYTVSEAGGTYGFSYPGQNSGILLMFSISSEG